MVTLANQTAKTSLFCFAFAEFGQPWRNKLPHQPSPESSAPSTTRIQENCQLSIPKDLNLPMVLLGLPYRTEFYNGDRGVVCLLDVNKRLLADAGCPGNRIVKCNCANFTLASV